MATRRKFIRDCSALAVSAAFLPIPVPAAPRRLREVSLATVPYETLVGLLGAGFVARGPERDERLELAGAEPWFTGDKGDDAGRWEAFSLYFRGGPACTLSQDTYVFEQPRIGRFEMFIVPVDRPDVEGRWYEAVFHRLPGANDGPRGETSLERLQSWPN